MPSDEKARSVHARFPSTHWSVVLAANAETSSDDQQAALEILCCAYYEPLYGYARRRGSSPDEALDLTQGFFVHLLESCLFSKTDPNHGRLRTFLLVSFRHYVAKELAKARTQKRGGRQTLIPLSAELIEGRYSKAAPRTDDTPETLFERRWALNLMETALARVGKNYQDSGRGDLFKELQETLTGGGRPQHYSAVAQRLGINEGAVKTAIHRLRSRFKSALRETISETLTDPAELDEEIRYLKAVLAT